MEEQTSFQDRSNDQVNEGKGAEDLQYNPQHSLDQAAPLIDRLD